MAALLTGLASSGLAVGISAEPGAASVAVSRVAYAERARSMAAASLATDELDTARQALEQGRRAEAARLITSVGGKLPAVRADDGRAALDRDHRQLRAILAASGGPPAADDMVLAAGAPGIEPSELLGGLVDRNDRLSARVPAPSADPGGIGANPSAVILADGPPASSPGLTTAGDDGSRSNSDSPSTTASPPASSDQGSAASGGQAASDGASSSEESSAASSEDSSSVDEPSTSEQTSTTSTTTNETTTDETTTNETTTNETTTNETTRPPTKRPPTKRPPTKRPPTSRSRPAADPRARRNRTM